MSILTATGKLSDLKIEYVGANETLKLTVDLSVNGKIIPVVYIGAAALNAVALTGNPQAQEGSILPGTCLSVYAQPSFNYWEEGNKTFTRELQGVDLMVFGEVLPEDSRFYFQGILFDYQEQTRTGNNGDYTVRSVKLLVPSHKGGEPIPECVLELNVDTSAATSVQNAVGQFAAVTGTVGSYTWTPKKGKNEGIPQRNISYTASRVVPMSMPEWVSVHPSFKLPEASNTAVMAAVPTVTTGELSAPLF